MKNVIKTLMLFLVAAVLIAVPVAMSETARADFGNFSGNNDFGGSSSGGSYSGGGSGGSYSGGSSGGNIYYYGGGSSSSSSSGSSWIVYVVVGIIVLVIVLRFVKASKVKPRAQGAMPTDAATLKSMAEYKSVDPSFDENAFSEKLSNIYVQMQNAWTDKNIESVRPYFTDAMFTQMDRQLQSMREQHLTNYVEKIAVLGIEPRGWREVGDVVHMIVNVRARIVDYTLNDATGELVSGDKTAEKFMVYEWDLCKKGAGMDNFSFEGRTVDDEGKRVNCPSCGAPLDINASARCPYCDAVVNQASFDWAISAIKGISQQTM